MADSLRDNLPARPFPTQGFLGGNGGNVPEYAQVLPALGFLPTDDCPANLPHPFAAKVSG